MPVLQVANLHKSYGAIHAVDGISFHITPGDVFGLLGPNGAGKSTTINIIASLLHPDRGEVTINGVPCSSAPAYKRKLGFVPQDISLAERLTARENLMLIGRLYDLSGAELRQRVTETLAAVELADRADDYVRTFSGGMKRRLNIAGALLHQPDLMLLDEPTTGVDPQARVYIFEIIERLAKEGRAILYTTHYMEEAQRLCRRIAIIDHGKILVTGTLAELLDRVRAKRELVIEAEGMKEQNLMTLAARLGHVPWRLENGNAHLNIADGGGRLLDALRAAEEVGIVPTAVRMIEPTLETVFLDLTGRALRD